MRAEELAHCGAANPSTCNGTAQPVRAPPFMGWHGISWAEMGVKGIEAVLLATCRFDFVFTTELPGRHSVGQQLVVNDYVSLVCSCVKAWCQAACKPGSVHAPEGAGRPFLWDVRRRTPRATNPGDRAGTPLRPSASRMPPATPIRSCSRWGLPCRPCHQGRGALLPHRFTLALRSRGQGGLFSVALSLGSPPPAVSRHRFPVEPGLSSTPRERGAAAVQPPDTGAVCARGVTASSRCPAKVALFGNDPTIEVVQHQSEP